MRGANLPAFTSTCARRGCDCCQKNRHQNQILTSTFHSRSLGEEDVLLGLYEKHISRQQLTKQALEAELQGDYIKALNIYEEATQHAAEGKDWGQGEGPNHSLPCAFTLGRAGLNC